MARPALRRLVLGVSAGLAVLGTGALPALAAGGPHWHVVYRHRPGGYASFTAVAVSGSHAWAVGSGPSVAGNGVPAAAYFSQGHWSASRLPGSPAVLGELTAVSADSPADAWALSSGGTALHWHAGRWSIARSWRFGDGGPPGPLMTGVTALSPANVWVFSPDIGTWHLTGKTWRRVRGTAGTIYRASAVSAGDIWAIAGRGNGSIVHYTNGSWRTVPAPAQPGLQFGSIVASSASSVWVTASPAGSTGLQLLHLHGRTWTAYRAPSALPLQSFNPQHDPVGGLSPDGHGGFWIAAHSKKLGTDWLVHFSAAHKWTQVAMAKAVVYDVVRVPRSTALWAVGSVPRTQAAFSFTNAVIWAYGTPR
jgi:hypothetical protein